ncbi:hypothetical protein TTHERM_00765120 (macronuclear) [Tetrahymena thermophila SB210]|uniref:Uncharacterized protein n=1 Tax=Tetrahymena thermophila (strain SB210) TaxID=312017 RepID=I7MJ56_TETTS|nr:hypothetical protein TTHERM_00765120 [Tetrahymena thermophila SB210]EAS05127.1 hypothetical protein TTHERM_00765120 [Tetrahymena thermophila SB210]|eukprot:XP_001025372.1 hypothetical protein TTHERM_00765120 [Tetrahymena thermophila SB210]
MDIENEDREEAILSNNEDDNIEQNVQQKRVRGRRKKQQQGWEETIEVVIPECLTKKDCNQEKKEQKPKKKNNQNAEMEIEEYGNLKDNYKDISKQIIDKNYKFKHLFDIIEYYNITIDNQKAEIQRENFKYLIQKVFNILNSKIQDLPLFLNYIQLLIDKSNLDLLLEFNEQLECDIKTMSEDQAQEIHIVKYQGGNQLFKILTHFKFEVENIIQKIKSKNKYDQPHLVLCVFDGAYNICKQDMIDIGKFFFEEYEQYQNFIQLVILFPVSQLISIPDIQIYTVEFCKQKDLFVNFLLFLLKSEEFPPLPKNLLRDMLNEFDLYSITYNDQVRRVKMAISNFVYEHQEDEDLIKLLQQMKEYALNQLAGQNKPQRKSQKISSNILIDKLDLWTKKKEIQIIIEFLERFYGMNFFNGVSNEDNSFSQKLIDQSHRIIEIILNEDKRYVMTEAQQNEFLKDPNISCKSIQQLLKNFCEDIIGNQIFKIHAQNLQDINKQVNDDIQKLKSYNLHSKDRYAKSQQISKTQSEKDISQQANQMKKERVENIVRQITYDLHQTFNIMAIARLSLEISQLSSQCKPDILGSLMIHKKIIDPMYNNHISQNKKKKQEIVESNADGLYLIHILEQYGKKFTITESFKEYKSILRERKIELDEDEQLASYYNAICELRYLGMIEEKRKLKNEFIKHFFAKSSYFPLSMQNS